ncbi:MAG TPA: phenylalanine--tRNA ligase subunit beta [Candidatus Korarchaeota archaeon]|nr:phenylalanine--tRNA ligase subunit beta [Candidatus Korarchaeota archaeon]
MPVISVSYSDLCRLVGELIPMESLGDLLARVKVGFEGEEEGELELEVTADRLDLVTVEGIARALKGVMGKEAGLPRYDTFDSGWEIRVDPSVERVRPYVVGAVVEGVELDEDALVALMRAQEKLHQTLGRDRRKMSMGIHNADVIEPPISYAAEPSDRVRFVPLGEAEEMTAREMLSRTEKGREYAHLVGDGSVVPVLRDSKGDVLSIPPILNGELTRVTESTRNLFIDVTGPDLRAISQALVLITTALAERGGRIGTVAVRYLGEPGELITPDLSTSELTVDVKYVNSVMGINLTPEEISDLLRRVRLGAEVQGDSVRVLIPPYRFDFLHPVDVVEEVAQAVGYDRLEPELPAWVSTFGRRHPIEKVSALVRTLMIGLGYQEILNYVMTSREVLFERVLRPESPVVEVANPVTASYSVLRDSLLPGVIAFLARNTGAPLPQKVFEVGDVVIPDESAETGARDERRVCAAIADSEVGFEDIQADLYALLRNLNVDFEVRQARHPTLLPGRTAEILVSGEVAGVVGEVNPEVLELNKIKTPVAAFELSLPALKIIGPGGR